MPTSVPTLKSGQRQRVLERYRGRGHRNNQLWLFYSYKTKRDWIINSDHELVFWLTCLECHTNVKSFDLAPETLPFETHNSLKFIQVELWNGTEEWHLLHTSDPHISNRLQPAIPQHDGIVIWEHDAIRAKAPSAMRWLKLIAFVSAVRDQSLTPIHVALIDVLRDKKCGTVLDLTYAMKGFDLPSVYGVIVRFCILGWISIDLTIKPFTLATEWRCDDKVGHVVS